MSGTSRPRFIKPAKDSLYPARNKDGSLQLNISQDVDSTLATDIDSKTSFTYNRFHHLPLEAQRQKLPIFQYRNHILYLLEKYQTLVLVGETGSGKSTQVPQYVCEIGHKVCVTQPRAAATVTLASRVADERAEILGEGVGYAISMDTKKSNNSNIVFVTEGVLLREMFASPLLLQYSCIVLDEVHERTQLTDVLMGMLKKIAKKRRKLKIIVSSATMDARFLRDFFNLKVDKQRETSSTSVIMSVQGRAHPVDLFYVEEPVPDYVKATVDTAIKIHENEPFGDILAFLTSQEEILIALELLNIYAETNNERNKSRRHFPSGINAANMSVLPMYGSLPHYKQLKVFQMAEKNVRKVILATNIAETSITIPGITYVIDCGFHKIPFYEPTVGIESLVVTVISQSNAVQRAGRAGRTSRGKCYRLYSESEYEKMAPSVPPEMMRSDLSSVLLQLKAFGIHNLLRFTFPTPPPAKLLLASLEKLYALQAIDKNGQLTENLGVYMSELPLKPVLAKILCSSGEYGCIDEAITIISMLQVDCVFIKSTTGKQNVAARISRRNNFEVEEGDLLTYLNVYDSYSRIEKMSGNEKSVKRAQKDWCSKCFINQKSMLKISEIRRGLEKLIKGKFKLENKVIEGPVGKCECILKCLVSGLFSQAAYLHADGSYRTAGHGATVYISPDSCLYRSKRPQWVVFTSVQCSGDKTYMRDVTTIKKDWLLEVAPHYYEES